jgi:hypothetical protein
VEIPLAPFVEKSRRVFVGELINPVVNRIAPGVSKRYNSPIGSASIERLESFVIGWLRLAVELAGGADEEARRHARSALDFANALQHRRTATFRDAALCAEATTTAVNVIAIVAGRRDPQ